jgi:hypothetical protein
MAKVLYEGYRIGKNGGERWTGTIQRDAKTGQVLDQGPIKTPKGGSAIKIPSMTTKKQAS